MKEAIKSKKPKRKRQDVGGDVKVGPRFPEKVLVPVTRESMNKVLGILDKFRKEKRCTAIVFNSCFYLDELPFDKITEKFKPIFGKLTAEQIFVRVDMPKLTETPEEAYRLGFKNLNQAYIIGDSDCTESDLNIRAAARQTFCCPMSLDCIRKNLLQGLYLMHRSIVLGPEEPNTENQPATEGQQLLTRLHPKVKPNVKNKPESAPSVKKQTSQKEQSVKKRDRIAATFSSPEPLCPRNFSQSTRTSTSPDNSSKKQASVGGKVDGALWKSISTSGDVVLRIRNLPLKESVNAFNLIMGTTSVESKQVVARKRIIGKKEVMDAMVVLKSGSSDLRALMDKNGLKTALGLELSVERSHHGELRKFLADNSNQRINLDISDKLPIKWIGYGNKCQ